MIEFFYRSAQPMRLATLPKNVFSSARAGQDSKFSFFISTFRAENNQYLAIDLLKTLAADQKRLQRFLKKNHFRAIGRAALSHKKLFCPSAVFFDFDSTLSPQEGLDEFARTLGVSKPIQAITELAMRGNLDFKESLRRRLDILRMRIDTPKTFIQAVKKTRAHIRLRPQAIALVKRLKKHNTFVGVVSGGFFELAQPLLKKLDPDAVLFHGLTYTLPFPTRLIDGHTKQKQVRAWKAGSGVMRAQTMAVGDGSNDVRMMKEASIRVAFCAKPILQAACNVHLNGDDFAPLFFVCGLTRWRKVVF